jgi:hypothetical protein
VSGGQIEKAPATEGHALRIGEILVDAGIIANDDLNESITLSRANGLPVGRVLVMSGKLSEAMFRSAVLVQSLVRDALLPYKLAVHGLSMAKRDEMNVETVLAELGFEQSADAPTNKLGELLVASEILSLELLDTAMRSSESTGLPLGRVLTALGLMSDELITTGLAAQVLVRDERLTRGEAIEGLIAARLRRQSVENMLKQQGYFRGAQPKLIRLGQLLKEAGQITDDQLWDALERSLKEKKSLGAVLLEQKLIDSKQLNLALAIQEMVANQTLDLAQAANVLNKTAKEEKSIDEVLAFLPVEPDSFKATIRFHELLRVAGVIDNAAVERLEIEKRGKPSSNDAFAIAKSILGKAILKERICYGALRCYFLIAIGFLNIQQGILALNYMQQKNCTFDEALTDLHWTIRTFIRDDEAQLV